MEKNNSVNFNKIRFVELLKKQQTLKNQKIHLFNENPKEYGELLSYQTVLEKQICYNSKAKYIFLIEEYLKGTASEDESTRFVWEFFSIFYKDNKAKEILEEGIKRLDTFYIDPKSTGFYSVFSQIPGECEALTDSSKDRISADQFSDSLNQIFLEIQKSLVIQLL